MSKDNSKSSNQLKAGTILSYLQMGIGVVINLVYTPIMIRLLGQSEYGLYNTVASTISMLSILSLGFNSSYIRYFSKYKNNDDKESIFRLNGLFLTIFIIIGSVALACGIFLANNLDIIFSDGLTKNEYSIAKVLMILLAVNLAISFPMSVFSNIISANEKFIYLKTLGMIRTVLGPLVTLPLLLLGYRSIAMVTVTLCVQIFVDTLYVYYVLFVLKNRFWFSNFEKGLFKSLFIYTSFIAINVIIDQINWNIDKMLLGRFKGTTSVAIYSVGYTLYTYYNMFSTSISGVFTPRVHSLINSEKNESTRNKLLTDLFIKVGRVQFLILGLVSTGVVFFGKRFIRFWAGEGYSESYYVALLLILPATIALIQNIGIEIQRAENKHQFRSIVYSIMAVINLCLSIYLCQIYGAIGSAIGTCISLVVANGLIMNIYYYRRCGINTIRFWKSIIRMAGGIVIPIFIGIIMNSLIKQQTILVLMIEIIIYTIIYSFSMWKYGMNQFEKSLIKKPIDKMLRRFSHD